jgi:hypothetical protein
MEISYVVNSNYNFYSKATKVLFESLDKTNYNWRPDFVIVVGESPIEEVKYIDGVKHCFVKYGGIDFTAANYIADNINDFKEYVFYMHDTVYVGPNFFNNVDKDFRGLYYKRLRSRFSMNIGLFKTEMFKRYAHIFDFLRFYDLSVHTIQYYKFLGIFYEDILCNMIDDDPELYTNQAIGFSYHHNYDEEFYQQNVDVYNTGVLRHIVYVPNIDFYKIKANIGRQKMLEWVTKL